MRYYQHHIGDFIKDTHFLNHEERSVYIQLVWKYYDTEQPIKINTLMNASKEFNTTPEVLTYLFQTFFTAKGKGEYVHTRIDSELHKMHNTNGLKSEGARSRFVKTHDGFDKFWKAYPNKKDKQKAVKAWNKYKPDIVDVLKALVKQSVSEQWKKDNGQYIPLPTTWLNGARWEDESSSTTQSTYANIK